MRGEFSFNLSVDKADRGLRAVPRLSWFLYILCGGSGDLVCMNRARTNNKCRYPSVNPLALAFVREYYVCVFLLFG